MSWLKPIKSADVLKKFAKKANFHSKQNITLTRNHHNFVGAARIPHFFEIKFIPK